MMLRFIFSGGDARKFIDVLEIVCENLLKKIKLLHKYCCRVKLYKPIFRYDKSGENINDIICLHYKISYVVATQSRLYIGWHA